MPYLFKIWLQYIQNIQYIQAKNSLEKTQKYNDIKLFYLLFAKWNG